MQIGFAGFAGFTGLAGFAGITTTLHTEDAGCAGSVGAAAVWAESGGVAAGGAGHFDGERCGGQQWGFGMV